MLDSRGASAVSPTSESELEELHQSTKMSIDVTSSVSLSRYKYQILIIDIIDYTIYV